MGVSRLARVQEALAKADGKLALLNPVRTAAEARAKGVPYGAAAFIQSGVMNARKALREERRAQLAKFGHKLNQSELRYAKYGDADGLHAAVAARRGLNLEANLKPALRELAARSERIVEFALVRDANGQLVEDNSGSGFKTAAKVGLGAAGAAGAAVLGTRLYHANKAMQDAGGWKKNWADVAKMSQAGNAQGIKDWQEKFGASAQRSARAGWMGKLGKVGNVLTKF